MIRLAETRWLVPLAAIMTIMLVAVAGVLAFDQFSSPSDPPATSQPPEVGLTAKAAARPAYKSAEQWREDAELAGAQIHYTALGQGPKGAEWAFQFYSPSTERLAIFLVAGGEATLMRDTLSPYDLPTFSRETWRIDSDEVLSLWWDRGGSHLVRRRPDSDVTLRLRVSEQTPRGPSWTAVGSVPGQQSRFVIAVDATDGSVIERLDS